MQVVNDLLDALRCSARCCRQGDEAEMRMMCREISNALDVRMIAGRFVCLVWRWSKVRSEFRLQGNGPTYDKADDIKRIHALSEHVDQERLRRGINDPLLLPLQ